MNLFPNLHFRLSYPQPETAVIDKAHMGDVSLAGCDYCFEEYGGRNELLYYPEYYRGWTHNPFLPILHVSIKGEGSGTTVSVRSRLRSRYNSLFTIIIAAWIVAEAIFIIFCIAINKLLWPFVLLPILIAAAVYLTVMGLLCLFSKSFISQLKKELKS